MAAGKFSFTDIMNVKSRTATGAGTVENYTEIYLNPYDVKESKSNFYSMENIQELADTFLAVGQQQPTVLARIDGEYKIISGHRRNLANKLLIEQGHDEYKSVRYLYKDMTEATFELSLLVGNAYNRELTAYEKTEQAARLKKAIMRARKEDGLELPGTLREAIADLLGESKTNIARMDKINASLGEEAKEEFKKGNLGITAAYETSKLPEEEQKEIAAAAAAGGEVRAQEIARRVQERKAGDDYKDPHPESITSLCYSCLNYSECNVKTGTCQKCDAYINKADAEKTDEQRYDEEQEAIDKETRRKLRERAETEKMEHLPSNTKEKKYIRVSKQTFNAVCGRVLPYLILKYEEYKAGQLIVMQEFETGKATGNTKELYISCVDTESTHTAITEGYCVLGICEKEIAVERGWLKEVSETDTGKAENE